MKTSKHLSQILIELEKEIENKTVIVRNVELPVNDRAQRQKSVKKYKTFNNSVDQIYLTDIHNILASNNKMLFPKCTWNILLDRHSLGHDSTILKRWERYHIALPTIVVGT